MFTFNRYPTNTLITPGTENGGRSREALVIVKAYPNPSAKYSETVCVVAITREEGLIRLYPIGFRSLPEEKRFKKYQCIHFRMRKHDSDKRPESYRPDEHSFKLLEKIGTKDNWRERWRWIRPTIGPTMCELIRMQKTHSRSLACIKPFDVDKLVVEDAETDWTGRKKGIVDQLTLFDPLETKLEKIPYVFRYRYRCGEKDCNGHNQLIIDWEIMEFYRRIRNQGAEKTDIVPEVQRRFYGKLCNKNKDTYFFVGNHSLWPSSFMVLGIFWPPKSKQSELF